MTEQKRKDCEQCGESLACVICGADQYEPLNFGPKNTPHLEIFNKGWCSGSEYELIPQVTAARGGIRFPTQEETLENEKKAMQATRDHPNHFGTDLGSCFICREVNRLEEEKRIEQLKSEHGKHDDYVYDCPTCEEGVGYGCPCCGE